VLSCTQVHAIDLKYLEDDAFLNDTIMDFYLR
jgi:Ulp1 family protease